MLLDDSTETGTAQPHLRDDLAIDRTELANERTLLAYIRTALALFLTGISGVHLPGLGEGSSFGPGYRVAGWVFIAAAAGVVTAGYIRYRRIRRRIRNSTQQGRAGTRQKR